MPPRVLIIDDEPGVRDSLRMVLEYEGYEVSTASGGAEGLERVRRDRPDLVFLDIKMPSIDGLEVLSRLREAPDAPPVAMISGHGTIATAVEATRMGAFDFIEKPLGTDKVLLVARNATRQRQLEKTVAELEGASPGLVGESPAMEAVRTAIARAAPTGATVLITGESGTGKELAAHTVHQLSDRSRAPFIRVNCAAIPEDLIESELFGHEKGSFTGAVGKQKGKFVQADSGTIFLDEIGDMSLRTQSKVLRVLQDGEVEPVGAGKSFTVDVRVVAATNKDLPAEIAAGRFREDLYFRLNVLPIVLPPLRERSGDVEILARHFIDAWSRTNGRRPVFLDEDAVARLRHHTWPGNVRELQNTIERLLIMGDAGQIRGDEVDAMLSGTMVSSAPRPAAPASGPAGGPAPATTLKAFREETERTFLLGMLRANDWNVAATARAIDTPRSNLYKKLEAYGIHRDTEPDS
ncbi:MAG: sigma-54-dependent transcriptional regulator [Acidobacteriota bacterium]